MEIIEINRKLNNEFDTVLRGKGFSELTKELYRELDAELYEELYMVLNRVLFSELDKQLRG